jgi:branched-subunit amino acid aminotransferase/4-amino-4-deoxychorismate lyase
MSELWTYINGEWKPQTQAALPLHDAGFVLGATVTDLCRTLRHKLFHFPEHLRRFRQSCQLARIHLRKNDEEITRLAEELLRRNTPQLAPEQDMALVLIATPGVIGYYIGQPGSPGDAEPFFSIYAYPLPQHRYRPWWRDGVTLITPSVRHIPPQTLSRQIKHRSRLFWWIAEQELKETEPQGQALLLDTEGNVTETASANFLLIRKGKVLSPPKTKILHGVTLQIVEEICGREKIPFKERDLTVKDFANAQEAFLTCTTYCLAPVRRINDIELPVPGPLYERIRAAWNRIAGGIVVP